MCNANNVFMLLETQGELCFFVFFAFLLQKKLYTYLCNVILLP